jgi:hypothetical protein
LVKSIPTRAAVGLTLCHDITEIIPGKIKHAAFKRGHRVRPEDVEHLLRLGKENLYIWEAEQDAVHEDEAARRLAAAFAGPGVVFCEPSEGRVNFRAARRGLFVVNRELLDRVNAIPDVTAATAHGMQAVEKDRLLAGTRVIPLAVAESSLLAAEDCCRQAFSPLLSILPFKKHRVAVVVTGREVFEGIIKDGFVPVLKKKFKAWGSTVFREQTVPDETSATAAAILEALAQGADMVCVTGGMSVDPDDRTPAAIRDVGCDIVVRGVPVFPGAMFMLGYKGRVPVLGVPGCVMYQRASVFDLVVPRILAGQRIVRRDLSDLAHGGLCMNCTRCAYPNCAFGKG